MGYERIEHTSSYVGICAFIKDGSGVGTLWMSHDSVFSATSTALRRSAGEKCFQ